MVIFVLVFFSLSSIAADGGVGFRLSLFGFPPFFLPVRARASLLG
jgi:hypothetical protein